MTVLAKQPPGGNQKITDVTARFEPRTRAGGAVFKVLEFLPIDRDGSESLLAIVGLPASAIGGGQDSMQCTLNFQNGSFYDSRDGAFSPESPLDLIPLQVAKEPEPEPEVATLKDAMAGMPARVENVHKCVWLMACEMSLGRWAEPVHQERETIIAIRVADLVLDGFRRNFPE